MRIRQYICVSLLNLGFLEKTVTVHAQAAAAEDFEEVSPTMTVGTAGIGTLLANRIAADQVMVNGYDVLKLDDAILNLLARKTLTTPQELKATADLAKVRPLRMKAPPAPPAPTKAPAK